MVVNFSVNAHLVSLVYIATVSVEVSKMLPHIN